MSGLTLYQRPSAWGLPSLSPAGTQVQAYLQLAGIEHRVIELPTEAESPTEQLPALEHGAELLGDSTVAETEYDAARLLLRYLKDRVRDLDRDLSAQQRAEVLALTSLVELHLEAATLYTTWVEQTAYSQHTKAAYGAALPFPINYWLPWRSRQAVQAHFRAVSATEVYGTAAAAYGDLAKQLQANYDGRTADIKFFFGSIPSSFDAVLYPHLLYHLRSPAAAPELRKQMEKHPMLVKYVEAVASATRTTVPGPAPAARGGWHRSTDGEQPSPSETAADRKLRQSGKLWLAAAGAAILAYVVISGQFVSMEYAYEDEEEEDE